MFRIALKSLTFRKGSFIASFIALFFGATILLACGGLMETGIRGDVPPQRLAAAPFVVTGDQHLGNQVLPERVRLPASLVTTLQQLPGVRQAVPDVSFPATVLNGNKPATDGEQQGHGWAAGQLAGYTLSSGTAPAGNHDVVLDATLARELGVSTGDRLELAVAGGQQTFQVSGVAASPTVSGSALYFSDAEADTLLGRSGVVDSIAVVPDTGAQGRLGQEIRTAIAGQPAVLLTGDSRGTAEFPAALAAPTRLISMSAVFGGIAVLVAVFVVGSTLALLVQQRQREMALLRAIGTTPRQLRRMVVGETLVIALAAVVAALAPGWYVGHWMLGRLAGGGVIAPQVVFHEGWIPMVIAAGVSLLSAVGAAFIAARGAARARPAEALAEAALQRRWLSAPRLVLALLCFAGTALAVVTATVMHGTIAASTAGPSAMLWAGGLALIGPGLTRMLTAALHPLFRGLGGLPGYLALRNTKARRIRVAGAVTPVMLATGLATALIYLQTSQALVTQQMATGQLRADAVVSSSTGGLSPSTVTEVAGLPGVRAASAYVTSEAYQVLPPSGHDTHTELNQLPVTGVSADAAAQVLSVVPTSGSFAQLTGRSIILPTSWTARPGQAVGDSITLDLGDGTAVPLRIVGSFKARPGFESGFLPADLLLAHSTTGLVSKVLVSTDPGTTSSQLQAALVAAAGPAPGLSVTASGSADTPDSDSQTSAWINYLLAGTIVGYAVISLVNTLIISATERRREFALQRLVGSTKAQVLRMMSVEAALVAVAGAFLGTLVGVATLVPFSMALDGSPRPQGPVWIYLVVIGSAAVLTLTATLLPTRLALRTRPAEVIAVT